MESTDLMDAVVALLILGGLGALPAAVVLLIVGIPQSRLHYRKAGLLTLMGGAAAFVVGVVLVPKDDPPTGAPKPTAASEPASDPSAPLPVEPRLDPPPKPALPEGQYRIKDGAWTACKTKGVKNEITGYIVDQDREAYERAMVRYVLEGECIVFEGGEIIHLVDTSILQGLIQVRKRGETDAYWTNTEAREVD